MRIIVKFLWRNVKENKIRTLLILTSITLSVALFFASSGISDTIVEMYMGIMRNNYGEAEMYVAPGEDSPSKFLRTDRAKRFGDRLDYAVGVIQAGAEYRLGVRDRVSVDLHGYDLDDLQQMNPLQIKSKVKLEPFAGRKIIVSSQTAEKYGLEPGDNLKLYRQGERYGFIVSGIAEPTGLLRPGQGEGFTAVVPRETLSSLVGARGMVSQIYMKSAPDTDLGELRNDLEREYRRYRVERTVNPEEIKEQTQQISVPFFFMLVMVIVVSVFIIYTAFKVITIERLPVLGTFRSIGATRRITNLLLLGESALYGLMGSVLGCLLGMGILKVMSIFMANMFYGNVSPEAVAVYSPSQFLTALLGGVMLSVLSSLVPVLRAGRIPIKDIVLDTVKQEAEQKRWKSVLGVIFILFSLLAPQYLSSELAGIVSMPSLILFPVGVILLVPLLTHFFTSVLSKPYNLLFGNEGMLALRNLKRNRSAFNSIALLAVGISSILLISVISFSVGEIVVNAYSRMDYDISMYYSGIDRGLERRVRNVEGVADTYSHYELQNQMELADSGQMLMGAVGVDEEYFDFIDTRIVGEEEEIISRLNEGRHIILGRSLGEKFNVEAGDLLAFDTERGRKNYRVIGFTNTNWYNGNIAYFPATYLKQDMRLDNYTSMLITTFQNPDRVVERIEELFPRRNPWLITTAEQERQNRESNDSMMMMLSSFSVITMLIGIFGIFNNFMVNFMTRKRTLAVFRSVGMDGWQMGKMNLLEAGSCGFIGGIIAVGAALGSLLITGELLKLIGMYFGLIYEPRLFIYGIIAGIIISLLSVLSPTLKALGLNLVEELKYE
ncbi:MAG: ABC transporter permease [Halanaerobiales bacterium]